MGIHINTIDTERDCKGSIRVSLSRLIEKVNLLNNMLIRNGVMMGTDWVILFRIMGAQRWYLNFNQHRQLPQKCEMS